ncbi:transaldolase [Phytomonospora endophytica]|uniref:Transaldolase n=1 Tax=Phytomonospora endophytica TaxID=714109 RepID=A0A841FHC1_9ACTN|nr:transaldolase [Phytomonospora endophytica]MBB6035616.1 transaldolase [Phytomonospora endophytica]GIG70020.1 transaldolase [Phytomonospora endophytica]
MTENNDRLAALSAAGVAVWLDDLSRDRINTGNLDGMRRQQSVVGVTTNPSIFANALAKGEAYAGQLADLATRKVTVDEAARSLTTFDVRAACDVLRPAFDASNGVDGRVSIEVDPRLAFDTAATVAEAKALWWAVDRENLFIKIPATVEGLPAISAVLAEGISVNVTLIFGLDRYKDVMDAFFTGLEAAKANGHDLSKIESVASFFVSRVDTEIDKRLDKLGSPEALALRGKAGVANARLAYQAYEEAFGTPRWQALADAGARPQRPLWASTGVKNPDYSDVLYVEELVAPGIVNTMPEATMRAFEDHGETRGDTITANYAESREVLDALAAIGVEYDDVIAVLEREGVEKFEVSWNELLATITSEMDKVG